MKIATIEDFDEIKAMALKFAEEAYISDLFEEKHLEKLIYSLLQGDQSQRIIILEPGKGMLAGMSAPFPFGPFLLATEIAWWVEPEARSSGLGVELLRAFEYWAKEKANCRLVHMVSMDSKVGKLLEKQGYEAKEYAYMKKLYNKNEEEIKV